MELSHTDSILHLRLNSCLETVLEFQRVLSRSSLAPELDGRFSELMDLVSGLDSSAMAEKEVAEGGIRHQRSPGRHETLSGSDRDEWRYGPSPKLTGPPSSAEGRPAFLDSPPPPLYTSLAR